MLAITHTHRHAVIGDEKAGRLGLDYVTSICSGLVVDLWNCYGFFCGPVDANYFQHARILRICCGHSNSTNPQQIEERSLRHSFEDMLAITHTHADTQ